MTQVPIVVAVNASPLIGLAKGRRLPLLRHLYDEVLIPSLVYDDVVVKGHRRAGARAVCNAVTAGWLQVVAVSDASVVPAEFQRIFPPHFAARRTIAEGYLLFCSLM